jgi:hypothetical protein
LVLFFFSAVIRLADLLNRVIIMCGASNFTLTNSRNEYEIGTYTRVLAPRIALSSFPQVVAQFTKTIRKKSNEFT